MGNQKAEVNDTKDIWGLYGVSLYLYFFKEGDMNEAI